MLLLARSSPEAWGQSERAASGVLGTGGGGGNREWGRRDGGTVGFRARILGRPLPGGGGVRGHRGCGHGVRVRARAAEEVGTLVEFYLRGRLRGVKCALHRRARPGAGSHARVPGADRVRALSP